MKEAVLDLVASADVATNNARKANDRTAAKPLASKKMISSTTFSAPPPHDNAQQVNFEYRDRFENTDENAVKQVSQHPISTFSADVDTASYSFVRRILNRGQLPLKDSVHIEEMINYFDYSYPKPAKKTQPFEPTVTVISSP